MVDFVPRLGELARANPAKRRNSMRELLDAETLPAELPGNLREIRLINRGLGWTAATLRRLDVLAGGWERRPWSYLDVATGSGDLPVAVWRHARRRGWPVEVHALDASAAVVAEARRYVRRAPVTLHLGDARALPFADGSFDVVSCALALHHFAPDEAVKVLRELARVARRAWLVVDLERSLPAYLGARALNILLRNPMTRHDAPASVLRAYTLSELRQLLATAGLSGATSARQIPFRLLAWGAAATPLVYQ